MATVGTRAASIDLWVRSGFEQAALGLAVVDSAGRHVLVNAAYVQQTGRARRALLGAPLRTILAPGSRRLVDVWAEQPRQPTTIEVTIDRPGAEAYGAALFLTPLLASPTDGSDERDHVLVQLVGVDAAPSSRDAAARLRALAGQLSELVVMARVDGTVTYVSPTVERVTGRTESQLEGTDVIDLVHPDDHATLRDAMRTATTPVVDVVVRMPTASGWAPHRLRVSEVRDQLGNLVGLAHVARAGAGVDESTADERSLPVPTATPAAEATARALDGPATGAGAVVADTTDLIWQFDHDAPVYANPAARTMIGLGVDDAIAGVGLADIHPPWAVERIARDGVPTTLGGQVWEAELAVLDGDGEEVPVSFVLAGHRDARGVVTHWSSISRPHDRAHLTEARLRWALTHDPLTSLPGRVLLLDRMEVALARATRTGQRVGLLVLDLDYFGTVHESVGSDIADRLLVAVAERLRRSIRPGDTIGRMSEDSFVVLCEHVDHLDDAERFAERLLRIVEAPLTLDGAEWYVSLSIGIALARHHVTTPDGLLRNATAALHRAKELGRGRHVVFGTMLESPALPLDDGSDPS